MRKTMIPTLLVLTLCLFLLSGLLMWREANAQTSSTEAGLVRTVSVNATGRVSAAPDQATITLGVRTQATTAPAALQENNEKMDTLIATLKQGGIAARDIQTSDFSIWPQYRSSGNTVNGYEVSNNVTITVRDLTRLGQVLDTAVKAGGNQVHGIHFKFSDPDALYDQAREIALEKAQSKANQLARLSNVRLGTVVTITEGGSTPPPIMMRGAYAMEEAADAAVPIEAGESELLVTLQVTYELLP